VIHNRHFFFNRGESETSWLNPQHLITYFRYLRFHPDGQVVSLLTTDSPADVVRRLSLGLRMNGLTTGRWCLRGRKVECWALQDPMLVETQKAKYSFTIEADLKSTSRGRMYVLLNFGSAQRQQLTHTLTHTQSLSAGTSWNLPVCVRITCALPKRSLYPCARHIQNPSSSAKVKRKPEPPFLFSLALTLGGHL
jgi:hypothetical protein